MQESLISIITPCYNAEKFIFDTYKSIKNQTYQNWEWIIVDDMSSDESCDIIEQFKDSKIRLYKPGKKLGPANARNYAVEKARGRYIAYIDADDLWFSNKLEIQVSFMERKGCAFSFTGYEFGNEKGIPNGKKIRVPKQMNYKEALKNTTIWTSTVMFDLMQIKKIDIYMPNIKSEDTALWWSLLKQGYTAYGLNEITAIYRRSMGTLSSNKVEAISRILQLYEFMGDINFFKKYYYFLNYLKNAVRRRI